MSQGPMSKKELQERLKKVKKIEFADSTQVERRAETLDRLVRLMGEVADADWKLSNVFISDRSSVGDFLQDDSDVKALSERLGFSVEGQELLIDIAMRMEPKN